MPPFFCRTQARKDLSHVTSLTTIAMFNDLTIAPLIPQLIELTAIRPQHMALGWPYLFTSTAPNLKRLTTNSNLTDELLSHVIDKLPGLEYLSVTTVELFNYIKTDTGVTEVSHKEQTWGVKQLVLGMSMTYSAERLAYLPSSREAGVRLTISGRVVAGEQQPLRLPIENAEVREHHCHAHMQRCVHVKAAMCACEVHVYACVHVFRLVSFSGKVQNAEVRALIGGSDVCVSLSV